MTATRRLAAILAADVAGYSRLMGADEERRRDVDAVAVEVVALDDHVAEIDADAQFDPAVRRDPVFRSAIARSTATKLDRDLWAAVTALGVTVLGS